MLLINNAEIARVLPMERCLSCLEEGFKDLGASMALDTGRTDIYTATSQEGTFHRSSVIRSTNRKLNVLSIRILSDMVNWPEQRGGRTEEKYCVRPGLFCGLVLLFDTGTGKPLALLNDGYLQHLTVGAGAGIGTKYLARADSAVLGVIGSGGQAKTFTDAVCAVRNIREIKVHSPTPENCRAFADLMREKHHVPCQALDSPREVFKGADILITATDSVEPVFEADWVEPGTHVTFVIVDELDTRILERADLICSIYTSSPSDWSDAPLRLAHGFPSWALANAEDLSVVPRGKRPAAYPEKTVSIIDVLTGKHNGRAADRDVTICGGGGGQRFTAVAGAVYQLAVKAGLGKEIPTDWLLQDIRD